MSDPQPRSALIDAAALNARPRSPVELIDAALHLARRDPLLYWGISALSLGPPLLLLMGLEVLRDATLIFATSRAWDGLLLVAALLAPGLLAWRALCHGALALAGITHLGQAPLSATWERRPHDALSPLQLLRRAADHALALVIAGWLRVATVWLAPIALLSVALQLDPALAPSARGILIALLVTLGIPITLVASVSTWLTTPRACLEGVVAGRPRAFLASVAPSAFFAIALALLTLNLAAGASLGLYVLGALLDVNVAVWSRFVSPEHRLAFFALIGLAAWLVEPIAQLTATLSWLNDRVAHDAIDLDARLSALTHARPLASPQRRPREGDRRRLASSALIVLATLISCAAAGAQERTPAALRAEVEAVLSGPELRGLDAPPIDRGNPVNLLGDRPGFDELRGDDAAAPRDPFESVTGLPRAIVAPEVVQGVIALAGLLTLLALAWVAARHLTRPSPAPAQDNDSPDRLTDSAPLASPDAWRSLAQRLAAQGDRRGAARALYLSSVAQLHHDGRLRYEPSLTNGELLQQLSVTPHVDVEAFRELLLLVEWAWYGAHPVPDDRYARVEALARRLSAPTDAQGVA